MRDKNLTYQQFHIQLSKKISEGGKHLSQKFLISHVSDSPTTLENFVFNYPRNFRSLRALSIVLWSLPNTLMYRFWLDLTDMSFSQLNEKQILELRILLSSKEDCYLYLYMTDRYTSHEVFGNILGNDLKELYRGLRFFRKNVKVRKTQRVRGYRDHGSRKPSDKWLPQHDFTFTEMQLEKERKLKLRSKTINRILLTLRTTRSQIGECSIE